VNKELIEETYNDIIRELKKAFKNQRYVSYTTKALLTFLSAFLERDWTDDLSWFAGEEKLPRLRNHIEKKNPVFPNIQDAPRPSMSVRFNYPANFAEYVTTKDFVTLNVFSKTFVSYLLSHAPETKKFSLLIKDRWYFHPKQLLLYVKENVHTTMAQNKVRRFLDSTHDMQKLEDLMKERRENPHLK